MGHQFHKEPEFDTLQVHAGQKPDPTTNARAVPIYATTNFVFDSFDHGAEILPLTAGAHSYSRLNNPTVEVFENRMMALEGGAAAIAVTSGQAAQVLTLTLLAGMGDNIVSSYFLYGGSYNQFNLLFKKFGITVKWVSASDPEAFRAALDERTKAIFVESIANPLCTLLDIPEIAKIAHEHNIPLVVDNTCGMGGYLIRPFELGADIIVHSATKWIGGHGTTIAGIIIDSGKFDWVKSGKYPILTTPAEGHRGLIFSETYGNIAFAVKIRTDLLRDIGTCMDPFTAFLSLQGLETLSLRAQRHSENALALAKWLDQHPKIAWVSYLGLPSHPSHSLALKLLRHPYSNAPAFGGVISFAIKAESGDTKEIASAFVNSVRLTSNLANLGDSKTLVVRPAVSTHKLLTEELRLAVGVVPELIRVSVGNEDIRDIIADFEAAIKIAVGEELDK